MSGEFGGAPLTRSAPKALERWFSRAHRLFDQNYPLFCLGFLTNLEVDMSTFERLATSVDMSTSGRLARKKNNLRRRLEKDVKNHVLILVQKDVCS